MRKNREKAKKFLLELYNLREIKSIDAFWLPVFE
jgi:hypothetical protein